MKRETCLECGQPVEARDRCHRHYMRLWRTEEAQVRRNARRLIEEQAREVVKAIFAGHGG